MEILKLLTGEQQGVQDQQEDGHLRSDVRRTEEKRTQGLSTVGYCSFLVRDLKSLNTVFKCRYRAFFISKFMFEERVRGIRSNISGQTYF